MKPHKHAEIIKAWADGEEIQLCDKGNWIDLTNLWPYWLEKFEYRVKNKNQALMDAHAKGAKIQCRPPQAGRLHNEWVDVDAEEVMYWYESIDYRIKPEFKHNRLFYVSVMENEGPFFTLVKDLNSANVKFTFNFETNELISVEKI